MKTAHVLLNPAARSGRNRSLRGPIARALAEAGIETTMVETTARGDAQRLAAELGALGETVIAAGGDGTVHEVVNGLVGTPGRLGVLPLGTGNDFAGAVGMTGGPRDLEASARALVSAPTVRLDAGRVRWADRGGESHQRWFANCLGMGFDASAASVAVETKWLDGHAAYVVAVLRTLWAWRRPGPVVRIRSSGIDFHGPLFLCEVGNGHSVGGGFLITPDARLDSGQLDVCAVRHLSTRRALTLMPKTFNGSHVGAPEVTMDRTERLTLTVEGACGISVQGDGEILSRDAVKIEVGVEPGVLSVLAPRVGPG